MTSMEPDLPAAGKAPVAGNHNTVSTARTQLAGKSGIKGLVSNGKTFSVGLFASLGGLVYGCK